MNENLRINLRDGEVDPGFDLGAGCRHLHEHLRRRIKPVESVERGFPPHNLVHFLQAFFSNSAAVEVNPAFKCPTAMLTSRCWKIPRRRDAFELSRRRQSGEGVGELVVFVVTSKDVDEAIEHDGSGVNWRRMDVTSCLHRIPCDPSFSATNGPRI